jgi:hypothetical protein
LGTAHRLVPEARFLPARLPAYQRQMEVALDALAAFTPSLEAEPDPLERGFGQVLLGIEGLHRLWGDEETLTGRVTDIVARLLPGKPRTGIANTRFGAQVAAVVGRGNLERVPVGDAAVEAAYLAPLSIKLLPADDETRDRMRVFGLTRIGQLGAISRSAVIARFGAPNCAPKRSSNHPSTTSSRCASCCAACARRCASSSTRAAPARPGQCCNSMWNAGHR